jgi:hypothetical protein
MKTPIIFHESKNVKNVPYSRVLFRRAQEGKKVAEDIATSLRTEKKAEFVFSARRTICQSNAK